MKSALLTLSVVFCSGWLLAQPAEFQGSFEQMKAEAQRQNRPMALYFYSASLCSPCESFERQTLSDSRVASLLDSDFLFMKLNGESLENNGFQIASKYRITLYPTLILFHPDGTVASNKAGMQTASMLIPELREVVPARNTAAVVATAPATGSVAPPSRPSASSSATRARAANHDGWWQIKVEPLPSRGYGVQVGVFSNYETINDEVNRLSPHYHYPMAIRAEMLGGRQVFKLVFGPFPSMDVARQFEKKYEQGEGRQAYIVPMGDE